MATRTPADTPLMRQYLDVKERYPDAIIFFRLGDFYEMFFEDAVIGSRLLDLTLTTRDKGKDDAVPMCGVPHHAARGYIAKLTELGHTVVMCEQVEDPRLAKGLVKRDVVRIVTPGIVLDDEVLDPKLPRYVVALVPAESAKPARARDGSEACGLAYLDATTGELAATELPLAAVTDELARLAPREIVCASEQLREGTPLARVQKMYGASRPAPWNVTRVPSDTAARAELATLLDGGPAKHPLAIRAAATVVAYAKATQPTGELPISRLALYEPGDAVVLDEAAVANLELVETLIGRYAKGSLLDVIDETVTAPGARTLRRWLLYPLVEVASIRRRQDAVAWLVERQQLGEAVRRVLSRVGDLERLAGKTTLGVATPRDLGRLRDALLVLPDLIELVRSGASAMPGAGVPPLLDLRSCATPSLPALAARLVAALVDQPPSLLKDGPAIRDGHDAIVDECRRLKNGAEAEILAIEEREQKSSGIASLKVRYNRVFGYYIEITKTHLTKVPGHYVRKQTVATGERYVTPELAELERRAVTAEETLAAREAELFRAEVANAAACAREVAAAGAALATLDVCTSFANTASHRGYCRPAVDDGLVLEITDGRHPVIEALLPAGTFVANDCRLDPSIDSGAQLVVITGPNMAGKSTYMRQVAQIVLLAQIGSFVPAGAATVGICDRVFTRVGAADNLSRGESTFMVEMRETATILAKATRRSLVVLDEVGRGTSTYDGVSIAWAVAEHLHDAVGARTLFATHYHELIHLAETRPRVRNVSVAVRERQGRDGGEIVFLRRVVPGGANKSYGVDVARLAGLPASVIARAQQVMKRLETSGQLAPSPQLSLLPEAAPSPVLARLAAIDIDRTTPLEALRLLAELEDPVISV